MANKSLHRIALLALLVAAPLVAHGKDQVPQWVRDAAAEKLPEVSPECDAVKLLEESTLTVQGAGKLEFHSRVVIKILRPQGRNYANLYTYFDKDSKLESFKIWSISADGREFQLRDDQISSRGLGGGNLYSDEQERIGTAPAADAGAVVAMEYDQHLRPYMNEDIWQYQSEIPALRETYTLELPQGFEYGSVWFHHSPMEATDLGGNRWRWTMTDVPAVDVRHVEFHPEPMALYQRMSVHYFGPGMSTPFRGDWTSIGEWFSQLAEGRTTATPEIAAKARELTAGSKDFYSKVAAIANFMQRDVRYYAIEIGVGGWQPHYAADIFHNRYGDCKDKATLLTAMLSAVGVETHLVMVDHRRGVVDPKSPSHFGDHMIAAIEVPPGTDTSRLHSLVQIDGGRQVVIFDPTQEWVPFGDLPVYEQGGYGLLMDGKHSQITALPVEAPETSTTMRTAKFTLQEDGTLSGQVNEARHGNAAWSRRERLSADNTEEQSRWLNRVVREDLANFTADDLKIEHLSDLDRDLNVSYQLTAPSYSRAAGNMLLLRPRVLGQNTFDAAKRESRHGIPVDLEDAGTVHDDFTIALPAGYKVDELPAPVKMDVGFASYESATTMDGNSLHYTRTLTIREMVLPAEKFKDVLTLASAIQADEQARAVLKHAE
jgi:Domain of Unknown Function with PDB structure (DUF3857)/Transglutaminase-like superfamily